MNAIMTPMMNSYNLELGAGTENEVGVVASYKLNAHIVQGSASGRASEWTVPIYVYLQYGNPDYKGLTPNISHSFTNNGGFKINPRYYKIPLDTNNLQMTGGGFYTTYGVNCYRYKRWFNSFYKKCYYPVIGIHIGNEHWASWKNVHWHIYGKDTDYYSGITYYQYFNIDWKLTMKMVNF